MVAQPQMAHKHLPMPGEPALPPMIHGSLDLPGFYPEATGACTGSRLCAVFSWPEMHARIDGTALERGLEPSPALTREVGWPSSASGMTKEPGPSPALPPFPPPSLHCLPDYYFLPTVTHPPPFITTYLTLPSDPLPAPCLSMASQNETPRSCGSPFWI